MHASYTRQKEKADEEVASGNRALFTLIEMWNELRQHQKEIVEPYRDKVDAWLNLPVSQPLNDRLSIDLKDLSFVMQADAGTFAEVLLEQRRFMLAAYLIESHRALVLSEVFPRLEKAGLRIGDARAIDEIEGIIGVSGVHKLRVMTAAIIKNFDENVNSSRAAFLKLRATLKSVYPDRKFIDFQPDP